jgi:hypothetical protein
LAAAEEDDVARADLRRVALVAVLVVPLTIFDGAFDAE